MALVFPNIDPVAIRLGPLAIRWYALSYIAGILLGWWHLRRIAPAAPKAASAEQIDDIIVWGTFGVVLGGRLGYVLFYQPSHYLAAPLEIFELWHGGMSFHGGALGVILAIALFARRHDLSFLRLGDVVVCCVPLGLFFGRLANFVNGELFGRPTDMPWGMIFPQHDDLPRHPSQLYEAFLEGVVLFVLLFALRRMGLRERPGFLGGAFLAGYGAARFTAEFFRQPDPFMGYLAFGTTEGQLLSIPLMLVGAWLMLRAKREPLPPEPKPRPS
jgi:phosphatidylglycerol:prolipoprotein diacylglycerol transferase